MWATDSLAKSVPDAGDHNAENYKSYRRRLDFFELQCNRRGPHCITEGVVLVAGRRVGRHRGHGPPSAREGICASSRVLGPAVQVHAGGGAAKTV